MENGNRIRQHKNKESVWQLMNLIIFLEDMGENNI